MNQKGENMKKIAFLLPVIALAACGQEAKKTLVSDCEQISAGEQGDTLVKCPMTEELAAIQAMEANSMFLSATADLVALAADAENVYVNVNAGACDVEGQVQYRVMVKNPTIDGEAMYAVAICQ